MTKESCNLIGREYFPVDNSKFGELNCGKNTCFLRNRLIFYSELFSIWPNPRPSKGTHSKSRQVWVWLGIPENTPPKVVVSNVTSPW